MSKYSYVKKCRTLKRKYEEISLEAGSTENHETNSGVSFFNDTDISFDYLITPIASSSLIDDSPQDINNHGNISNENENSVSNVNGDNIDEGENTASSTSRWTVNSPTKNCETESITLNAKIKNSCFGTYYGSE